MSVRISCDTGQNGTSNYDRVKPTFHYISFWSDLGTKPQKPFVWNVSVYCFINITIIYYFNVSIMLLKRTSNVSNFY